MTITRRLGKGTRVMTMKWIFDDGGRAEAGFKGRTGDCVCRAIAIAAERPYKEVYDLINEYAKAERTGKRKKGVSSARTGVYKGTLKKVMKHYGFEWHSTMGIGTGCTVHLREDELPSGRLVVNLSRHSTAVIDGVIHDTYDPNDRAHILKPDLEHEGKWIDTTSEFRCVYGYFKKKGETDVA